MKKGIIGVSGEYFVAAELSQMGIIATLTLKNTPKIDILATNLETGKFVNIQVKTMSIHNNAGWRLSKKDEEKSTIKNHFYVLVNLKGTGNLPEYYIIPQKDLAEFISNDYIERLGGKENRNDTTMRVFDPYRREKQRIFGEKYKNNWGILNLN
ncbi:aspartate ammonia-lyase [Candidatus Gracilibacteria bacterium]|nr:aspartate ammonia-lyase [Candidatus Gracilibacteria bacterium]